MQISEHVGSTCSSIGAILGYAYLQISNMDEIDLVLPKVWIEIGITACVFSFATIGIISAIEKWQRFCENKKKKK